MAKSLTPAARKSKKNPAVAAAALQLEGGAAQPASADADLSALMQALDAMPDSGAEFVKSADEVLIEAAPGALDAAELENALAQVEAVETMIADATVDMPDGTVSVGADGEPLPAEPVTGAVSEVKPARVPRKHYTNKADRIADRLGDKLVEYTVLTASDAAAAVDEEALKVKMAETMGVIRGMNKKCQNRASLFMEFVAGKKVKLNEVIQRALTILAAEGKITTGKDGNLLKNLLARPYSEAAARAMGGNTISMLEDLRVLTKGEKGVFYANPESLLLMKANALLKLTPGAVTAAAEVVAEVTAETKAEPADAAASDEAPI